MMVTAPKHAGAVLMSIFNVHFKIVFKTVHLCISWSAKNFDNTKVHGMYVKITMIIVYALYYNY
jgi:hypothetical protein